MRNWEIGTNDDELSPSIFSQKLVDSWSISYTRTKRDWKSCWIARNEIFNSSLTRNYTTGTVLCNRRINQSRFLEDKRVGKRVVQLDRDSCFDHWFHRHAISNKYVYTRKGRQILSWTRLKHASFDPRNQRRFMIWINRESQTRKYSLKYSSKYFLVVGSISSKLEDEWTIYWIFRCVRFVKEGRKEKSAEK